MPSKGSNGDSNVVARAERLHAFGLDERLAGTGAASEKTTSTLEEAFKSAQLSRDRPDPKKAGLVYTAVTKLSAVVGDKGRHLLMTAIGDERLNDAPHVEAAAAWLVRHYKSHAAFPDAQVRPEDVDVPLDEFEREAGVGVVISDDDIASTANRYLASINDELVQKRYRFNTGLLQRQVMDELKFADGKKVNEFIKSRVEEILGPKTDADLAKPSKIKKPKAKAAKLKVSEEKEAQSVDPSDPFEGIPSRFEARGLSSAENTPELLELHRKATGGKIVTRFPPEPNGYLHVGHSKAMFLDFGYAKKMNGGCILRFDDTNPTVEKTEYIDAIIEMVDWMGHKPAKITYSSDYFDQLFDLAKELIRRGKAFVCHQTGDEISRDRKEGIDSPYRNRSVGENVKLFDDMRKGKYAEGEATLRMKIDMKHPNLAMRDPVAYRVLHTAHPHVGDKWCVYPSYDYTHCVVDSLEWVTHSLCTLEFEIRRDSYYWLLEALDLYRPFVWESARLNLEYTVMSKRKLKELVESKYVRGWDDPRMPTLAGMRRRGYTAEALNRFCAAIGVSRSNNMIGMHVLEHWVRAEHDSNAKRVLAVLRPLRVTISNFRGDESLSVAYHPKDDSMGSRDVRLTKTVFIERTDFRMEDEKGYYGLAPNKCAMLRYAYPIKVCDVRCGADGEAEELIAEMDYDKSVKPKGVLHWVSDGSPSFECRMYSRLFKSADPSALKDDWLDDLNNESEVVSSGALIEDSLKDAVVGTTYQFERTGYFTVDKDSSNDSLVFNMTVSLRDSR